MKRLLIAAAVLISVFGMVSSGGAFTVTVINDQVKDSMECWLFPPKECWTVEFMAEVNFYYNAIENVKAETDYIPGGSSYTYNSGAWCPSGVTGVMHIKKTKRGWSTSEHQKFIIRAADNRGKHEAGLNVACQNSTFKIWSMYSNPCQALLNGADNKTFSFERQ